MENDLVFLLIMKQVFNLVLVVLLMISLNGCHADYCIVKGTVKGIEDGVTIHVQDAWNHYELLDSAIVENGAFEFRPAITSPTHVYLYQEGTQLKDFILEPGTIFVDIDAGDEMDCFTGAAGTESNDAYRKLMELAANNDVTAVENLQKEIFEAKETGPLALLLADVGYVSSFQALNALDRLSPDLSQKTYAIELKEELSNRLKTEPRAEGSDFIPVFIDLEYPDSKGQPISLSSVVNNPDNRVVLLDFWATWCAPCVAALPQLKETYAKYHDKGFEIYSVSEDTRENRWKSFLTENGMTWVNVLDNTAGRENSKAWKDYSLNGIPTVLLIDGNTGEILARGNHLELDTLLSSLLQ